MNLQLSQLKDENKCKHNNKTQGVKGIKVFESSGITQKKGKPTLDTYNLNMNVEVTMIATEKNTNKNVNSQMTREEKMPR